MIENTNTSTPQQEFVGIIDIESAETSSSLFIHRTGGTKNDTERVRVSFCWIIYIKTYIHFSRRKRIKETFRLITAILISEHLHNGKRRVGYFKSNKTIMKEWNQLMTMEDDEQ